MEIQPPLEISIPAPSVLKKPKLKSRIGKFFLNPTVTYVFYCLVFFGIVYSVNLFFVQTHENLHAKIYENYNISSVIRINYFTMAGSTQAIGDYYGKCDETCEALQTENEIISYPIGIILNSLFCIFGLYILYRNTMALGRAMERLKDYEKMEEKCIH